MAEQWQQLLLRGMPPELKLALMREAEHAQSNLQAVALAILSKEFGVTYEPRHARANAPDEKKLVMNLRMPEELHRAIRVRAAEQRVAHSEVAMTVLAEHLHVELGPQYLGRRGRKVAA